jgi:hypothetical protein
MAQYVIVKPARVRKTWDLILTIILLVLYVGGVVTASFASAFVLAFSGDSCGAVTCDYDQMAVGFAIAAVGVWVPVIVILIASIVLLVVRRVAFWIPIVGMLLTIGLVITGFAIAFAAVPLVAN